MGVLPQASGDFRPVFQGFVRCRHANFSLSASAQFERILRRSETIVKLQMDRTLRFWVDVAVEHIKLDDANLTKRQLLAQILQQYERRGDALRCLDKQGKIVWKASPRFLTMLADAERDARDDLAEFP
jgi:hypothetical protein